MSHVPVTVNVFADELVDNLVGRLRGEMAFLNPDVFDERISVTVELVGGELEPPEGEGEGVDYKELQRREFDLLACWEGGWSREQDLGWSVTNAILEVLGQSTVGLKVAEAVETEMEDQPVQGKLKRAAWLSFGTVSEPRIRACVSPTERWRLGADMVGDLPEHGALRAALGVAVLEVPEPRSDQEAQAFEDRVERIVRGMILMQERVYDV